MGFTTKELKTDQERENELKGHSEKLALIHALSHSEKGEPIVIDNNLRTCGDCHEVTIVQKACVLNGGSKSTGSSTNSKLSMCDSNSKTTSNRNETNKIHP